MQCPACKSEVAPEMAFCSRCGASIAAPPSAAPEFTTVPQSAFTSVPESRSSEAPAEPVAGAGSGFTDVPPNAAAQPPYTAPPPYAAAPQAQYAAAPPAYGMPGVGAGSGLSDNAASALAYITFIPAIVFLVLEPYNRVPLVRFHSWQSILLFVGAVALQIAVTICSVILHFIPFIGVLFALVHLALGFGLFVLWIFVLLKASKGEWYKLPVLGDFAEKQARG